MIFAYIILYVFLAFNAVTAIAALIGLGFVISRGKSQAAGFWPGFFSWGAFIGGLAALAFSWGFSYLATALLPPSDWPFVLWAVGYGAGVVLGVLVGGFKAKQINDSQAARLAPPHVPPVPQNGTGANRFVGMSR